MARELLDERRFRAARPYGAFWLWKDIVGDELSKRSQPERIDGRTLYVRVASAPWAEELFLMKSAILRALKKHLGPGAVKDVRFRVATPDEPLSERPSHPRPLRFAPLPEKAHIPREDLPEGDLGEALLTVYTHAKERGRSS